MNFDLFLRNLVLIKCKIKDFFPSYRIIMLKNAKETYFISRVGIDEVCDILN